MHTDVDVDADLKVCPVAACGRPVLELVLPSGKALLVDPAPHELGSVVRDGDGYRVLPGSLLPAEQAAWRLHAQTCLGSLRNRRRAWNTAPVVARDHEGPTCTVCKYPLDDVLVRAGQRTHPSCDEGTEER